jgi:hypothetical protein
MDGNQEFPIPLAKFAKTLKGTRDEVWVRLLQQQHGRENHTQDEWKGLIDRYRPLPAHPTAKKR